MAIKVRGKVVTTAKEREEILSDGNPNTVESIVNVSVQNMDSADVHFIFNGGDEILVEAGEVLSLGNTLEEVGSNLFDALRQMDKMNIDIVYSEEFPTDGVGQAIMNRLLKLILIKKNELF